MASNQNASPKKRKKKTANSVGTVIILLLLIGILAMVAYTKYSAYQKAQEAEKQAKIEQEELEAKRALAAANAPPSNLVNDSVSDTIRAAAAKGWAPCPGNCLKLATVGWINEQIKGYSTDDRWYPFPYGERGVQYFSQRHCGHIIKVHRDRPSQDIGICPVCGGTGWVKMTTPTPTGKPVTAKANKKQAKKTKGSR